ncbi:hypothetical protein EHS13_29950 [Paenibacillus psychroresistens]|uniref:Uncharacterized protein n=1 Tax=Paenibacillus psychroresistens TaxID=1778678 RepID=A0A6B8RQY8_9BACL|nr:hypothetical protein [Paenibacillus psychroresistens]QGQ98800.1 hypothetical protein EHS13_29950 [Paenibacillus psychroresistens]
MIYGASLGPYVKKALLDKGFQTNVNKIIENLPLDPEISNMDAIVLSPKDMNGILGRMLEAAIQKKHASVKVLFFYQKEKEAALIDGDVKKIKIVKVTIEAIGEGISEFFQLNLIGGDTRVFESSDNRIHNNSESLVDERDNSGDELISIPILALKIEEDIQAELAITVSPEEILIDKKPIEQRVMEMGQFADFAFFKQSLEKDEIFKDLMQESTQYSGLVNLLEVMDIRIAHIFKDTSLTAELKFEEIKQIGIDRSAYQGLLSHIVAEKVISIMVAIVKSAEATVDARIDNVRKALDTITTVKLVYEDQGKLQALIESRLSIQMDLMELSKEIIEVYKAMDESVNDLLGNLDEDLPSKNIYINEIMKPLKPLFSSHNVAAITSKLIGDLQKNRISLSIMEDKVKSLVNLVFKLCEEDATIIEYQQKLINLLQAQRVEDVVIVDSVIKNSLRIFVGASDTGRTATSVTWSGVLSRRQNTLLLDLTKDSKLGQYGLIPLSLDDFMKERIERPFLCLEGNLDNNLEKIDEVVAELKTRLNYYAHINVILDASQIDLLNQLAPSALSVHFITDCTPRGTRLLKRAVEAFTEENIAIKVILIDPPVEPIRLLSDLSIDPLIAKLIIIPRLQYIRVCSLTNAKPYESKEIVEIFEEAFR